MIVYRGALADNTVRQFNLRFEYYQEFTEMNENGENWLWMYPKDWISIAMSEGVVVLPIFSRDSRENDSNFSTIRAKLQPTVHFTAVKSFEWPFQFQF